MLIFAEEVYFGPEPSPPLWQQHWGGGREVPGPGLKVFTQWGAEGGTPQCGKAIIKFLLPALLSEEEGVPPLLPSFP